MPHMLLDAAAIIAAARCCRHAADYFRIFRRAAMRASTSSLCCHATLLPVGNMLLFAFAATTLRALDIAAFDAAIDDAATPLRYFMLDAFSAC